MGTIAQLSPKQHAMRAEGLGASEVPTALGLNPFQSAAELAAVKRHEMEPSTAGEAALWGQRFERPIADELISRRRAEGHAWSIFTPPTLVHPACDVLMATCDRIFVPEGRRARTEWIAPAEIKNLSAFRREEFGEAVDDIPERILVQVQVQLEVTGLDFAWLAVVLGGQQYQEREIRRDRELGGQLVEFTAKWWADHVVQGIAVPVDGSEASTSYLRRRFPSEAGPMLDPSPEAEQLVAALRVAKETLKAAKAAEAEAGNALRALIGEASGVATLATWKANKPGSTTEWEALARSLAASPEQIAKFTQTKPGARVLRLLGAKE